MKYRFRSFLAPRIESYMTFIAKLGYRVSTQTTQSRSFDAYLKSHRITTLEQIDQQEIFKWVHLVSTHAAGTKNLKIRFARGFFRYLRLLRIPINPNRILRFRTGFRPFRTEFKPKESLALSEPANLCGGRRWFCVK